MNGGYTMVNCGGLEISTDKTRTYPGLYQQCKTAIEIGKPVFAYNVFFVQHENVMTPIAVTMNYDWDGEHSTLSDTIVVAFSTVQLFISTDDSVQIVNNIPEE